MKYRLFKFSLSIIAFSLITFILLPANAQCQGTGILTFLNAVSLDTPTQFLVNKVSLKPAGFDPGFCTSALEFEARPQTVVARNGNLESDPVIVTPSSSSSPIVVASLLLKEDKDTKELKPKLIVLAAANLPKGKGKNYQVYYSSVKQSTDFTINKELITLKGGEGKNFLGVNYLSVQVNGKSVAEYVPENSGNFFVILYDKPDGSIGANIAEDSIYFVPPK